MLLYIHIKRFIIWSIVTFLFCVVVSLTFLFSRDLTLNTVKINEFKIFSSFLEKVDNIIDEDIINYFSILLSDKKYPLLPIAIISEKNCIENVLPYYDKRFNLSICNKFNYELLNNIHSSDEIIINDYEQNKIIEHKKNHYIYIKLSRSNTWLVAKIENYYKSKDVERFIEFLTDDTQGLSWLGSLNSFKSFILKSKFIWIVIITFSLLLYILNTWYYLKQTNKLRKLNIEKATFISQWNVLNEQIKDLKIEQIKLEKELIEKSKLDIKNQLNDEIRDLADKNERIINNINMHIEKIKDIEEKEEIITNMLTTTQKKLTNNEKEHILEKSLHKLEQVDLLWKYQPTWKERHEIENIVSLREEFTPFTISQAFICFEKIIENIIVKESEDYKNISLVNQINLIFEKELLPKRFENDLHLIRKARNKWFHSGKQPNKEVYDILLDILDKTNTQPLL